MDPVLITVRVKTLSYQDRRDAIRAYMAEHGVSYIAARRAIDATAEQEVTGPTGGTAAGDSEVDWVDLVLRSNNEAAATRSSSADAPRYKTTREDWDRVREFWARWQRQHGLLEHHEYSSATKKIPTESGAAARRDRGERRYHRAGRFRLAEESWFNDHERIYSSFFGLVIMYSPYVGGPYRRTGDDFMGGRLSEAGMAPIRETAKLNNAVWAVSRVGEGPYSWSNVIASPDGTLVHTVSVIFVIPLAGYAAAAQRFAQRLARQAKPELVDLHPWIIGPNVPPSSGPPVEVDTSRRGRFWDRWVKRNGLVRAGDYEGELPTETDLSRMGRFRMPASTFFGDHRTVYSSFFGMVVMFHPYARHGDDRLGERLNEQELAQVRQTAELNGAVWATGKIGEGPYSWLNRISGTDSGVLSSVSVVFVIPLVGYETEATTFAQRMSRQFKPRQDELPPALRGVG